MDISLKHEEYKFLKTVTDNSVEECIEADFSLPEYMPEILRIIKSVAVPKIDSCRLVGERVTVDGTCELRMIYTAEDGCIYSFTQSRPFTRHCENSAFSEAVDVVAKAGISYVNCRATGTKRAEIKAGVTIKVIGYIQECEDIVSLSEKGCIEEKSTVLRAMSSGCRKTRRFSMSDTVAISNPSAFLISTNAAAVCTDIKKISNKIMIKGEATVDICYVNANDKTVTEHIKHNLPINQILEFEGMEERYTGNVTLSVSSLDVIQKNEADSFANAFDVSLGIDASVTMWEEKEQVVICDAYAVGANIDLKKSPYYFYCACDEIRDTYIFKDNFKVAGEGVSSIADCTGEITSAEIKLENSLLVVCGTISLSMLLKDTSGSLTTLNKVIDYRYERKIDFSGENISCLPEVVLMSVDCNENGNSSIDIRCELRIVGTVFEKVCIDAVTDITESDKCIERKNNAITVYFPDKEESLWSIARRYNTTVEAIACENELEGETTGNLKIIFIPAV